jgi:hypothetical protein
MGKAFLQSDARGVEIQCIVLKALLKKTHSTHLKMCNLSGERFISLMVSGIQSIILGSVDLGPW